MEYSDVTWWGVSGPDVLDLIRFLAQNMVIKYLICIIYAYQANAYQAKYLVNRLNGNSYGVR